MPHPPRYSIYQERWASDQDRREGAPIVMSFPIAHDLPEAEAQTLVARENARCIRERLPIRHRLYLTGVTR